MSKKTLGLLLLGASFFFCSCVDDTYDLNKEITTDIELKGGKIAFPVGSFRPMVLDSLLGKIELIDNIDGDVYALRQSNSISAIEMQIDPVMLTISPQSISASISTSGYMPSYAPGINRASAQTTEISIPFNEVNDFAFDSPISKQFKRIESFTFSEYMDVTLSVNLDGLQDISNTTTALDIVIEFPAFFNKLQCDDQNVTIDGNKIHINKEYSTQSSEGLSITLRCSELNFKNEENDFQGLVPVETDNYDNNLSYRGKIVARGNLLLDVDAADLANVSRIEEIGMNIDCTFSPLYVHTFNGVFHDVFDPLQHTFPITLGEQLEALKGEGNHIVLSEPQVEVVLYNNISMPTYVDLELIGKDKEGNVIETAQIKPSELIRINPAKYDEVTGLIVTEESRLFISDVIKKPKEGYQNIAIPNLAYLLECVPDSINMYTLPIIDPSVTHHIDITQPLSISADYDIIIPFKFQEFEVHYSDVIPVDLNDLKELEELDELGDASLKIKMDIVNTIPLGLTLDITALDEYDNIIDDIEFEPIRIKSGNGESIHEQDDSEKQEVVLAIDSDKMNFNKLKLDITAKTSNAKMGLKSSQGMRVSNLVIEFASDLGTNK